LNGYKKEVVAAIKGFSGRPRIFPSVHPQIDLRKEMNRGRLRRRWYWFGGTGGSVRSVKRKGWSWHWL